ncbi:MAG: helix-turn-helix transcriptional regulator [Chitinophagales bacterium]|nr:helix-turn-helix transcriptional regulator [Chitinophagales bacterium]
MAKIKDEKLCPVLRGLSIIRGRWTLPIIHTLMDGTKRFKELERAVHGINTRMLVKELKELEAQKIVTRKAYATIPPKVEYSLTDKGKGLKKVMNEIEIWCQTYS